MMTDPISDFLSRIRNALTMRHEKVGAPSSKMKVQLAEILKSEGYISGFSLDEKDDKKQITIQLKYDDAELPIIEGLKRISRPGLRVYRGSKDLPKVRGGMGMAVVSTSHGIMTDHQARDKNVGGEVLCYVW